MVANAVKRYVLVVPIALALGLVVAWLLGPQLGALLTGSSDTGTPPPQDPTRIGELERAIEVLRPLHTTLGPPKPRDWLYHHKEPGQTFKEYLNSRPVTPRDERRFIYVQPLGEFTDTQRRIVTLAADFIGRSYNVPVAVNDDLPLSLIPKKARRLHWGKRQILTGYVLHKVLKPRLADDAAAYIAFTTSDLWPGEGWNFVFGQASLRDRVGVWSINRFGDAHESEEGFRLCLLRTMKTGTHELGHMFGMLHCTAYECGMCGSNSLPESDRRPLAFCPECMAKVCWATSADPIERYRKLTDFCQSHGLTAQADFYDRSIKALAKAGTKE